jgi:hypothetical protein
VMRGGREVRLGSFSLPAACLDVNSSSLITDACVCVCVWTPYISVCGCVCVCGLRIFQCVDVCVGWLRAPETIPGRSRPAHFIIQTPIHQPISFMMSSGAQFLRGLHTYPARGTRRRRIAMDLVTLLQWETIIPGNHSNTNNDDGSRRGVGLKRQLQNSPRRETRHEGKAWDLPVNCPSALLCHVRPVLLYRTDMFAWAWVMNASHYYYSSRHVAIYYHDYCHC